MTQVVRATVRCTVSGVCGSGTVVGRDRDGNAIVLTNAHVAGTKRGRVIDLQRWNPDGSIERGQGAILAAGYGRGLSIDFALLRCNTGFAKDVRPIPLADRYPDPRASVTTFGCPRCEWPSLQVLRITRGEGQVLRWLPEAIGGRSGSSVVDYTEVGPRVVGLLTWGGGGEGLGQSTPFLLDAMRGRLPKAFEAVPHYADELSAEDDLVIREMPCSTYGGHLLSLNTEPTEPELYGRGPGQNDDQSDGQTDGGLIDSIVEKPPKPDRPGVDPLNPDCEPAREGPIARLFGFLRRSIITILMVVLAAAAAYFYARKS